MNIMNKQSEKTIFVIDDDPKILEAIQWLFESVDLPVETFDNAQHFIDNYNANRNGCLIVDVRMPGMSGLELLEYLKVIKCHLPVIVITGHGDVPMAVRAMKAGAVDFISKPFNDQYLIDKIQTIFLQMDSVNPC
jgi:FixJ family two-component response regulator